ncbi:hypothetical protein EDC48_102118 [Gibbsiella quercinecans]|nr:hypothetical protein EDC48_102118 [Gibbsiella quercinecans]
MVGWNPAKSERVASTRFSQRARRNYRNGRLCLRQ